MACYCYYFFSYTTSILPLLHDVISFLFYLVCLFTGMQEKNNQNNSPLKFDFFSFIICFKLQELIVCILNSKIKMSFFIEI